MDTHDRGCRAQLPPTLALTLLTLAATAWLAACSGGSATEGIPAPDTTIGDDAGGSDADLDSTADAGPGDGGNDTGTADVGADAGAPCTADDQCEAGLWCLLGECADGDCARGEASCLEDGTLRSCTRGVFTESPCPEGLVCIATGTAARCGEAVCEPDSIGCINNSTAFLCDSVGAQQTLLPCRDDQYCDGGACIPQVCEPSTAACDGNLAVTCNDAGSAQAVTDCATGCAAEAGCTCRDGTCAARVCVPGAQSCDGDSAVTCADDGFSQSTTPCADAEICLAGECVPTTCSAGSQQCLADVLATCNATGTDRTLVDCAESEAFCDSSVGVPRCVDQVCTPLAQVCTSSTTRGICDARGASQTLSDCSAGFYCLDGACVARVCEPSDTRCSGTQLETCNALGSGWTAVDCNSSGRACVDSGTVASCVDRTCTPGARVCNGAQDSVLECNTTGTAQTTIGCASTQFCQSGACVSDVCTASTRSCSGDVLQTCNALGSAVTTTNCAASSQWCDASGTPMCRARICTPGTTQCSGNSVQTCNTSGSAWTTTTTCDVACTSGVCVGGEVGSACTTGTQCDSLNCSAGLCAPEGMEHVAAGTFGMGADAGDTHADLIREFPEHSVQITRGIYVGRFEVTQQQWLDTMGANPSRFLGCGLDCPVESVSWYDSMEFMNQLSARDGLPACYALSGCVGNASGGCGLADLDGYCTGSFSCSSVEFSGVRCGGWRLPTEAEWEWAVGRGTESAFPGGNLTLGVCDIDPALAPYGLYCANNAAPYADCWDLTSGGSGSCVGPAPVGSMLPHLGLWDGLGNVHEWVWDRYELYTSAAQVDPTGPIGGLEGVMRGGSWWSWALNTRFTYRRNAPLSRRSNFTGLRAVRTAFAGQCVDRVQNGSESDVDCGGTACALCDVGAACIDDTDCNSGYCLLGTCAPR